MQAAQQEPEKARVFSEVTAYAMARALGRPYATVKHWYKTGVIPTRELRDVAEYTGVPIEDCLPPPAH